jgi:hypothetical protein
MSEDANFLNHLQQRNLECFLEWQQKYRRCYVEADPWAGGARLLFDRHLDVKRRAARAWLSGNSPRWKKGPVRMAAARTTDAASINTPRPIWTARGASKRRET